MWTRVKKAKDAQSFDEAYAYAVRLLEFRFRGRDELLSKLHEKGFTPGVAQAVALKLSEQKYVDDARLLEGLIREYKEFGLYGPVYIKQKLLQRKFKADDILAALRRHYSKEDESQVAQRFVLKYGLHKETVAGDVRARSRAMQRLARRGFSADIVYAALGRASDM